MWHLELLLFFKNNSRALNVAEASKALYLSADVLQPAIYRFRDSGILSSSTEDADKFRYGPKSDAMKKAIEELERNYSQQRVTIINLIFSGNIQSFADAFKLRREEE